MVLYNSGVSAGVYNEEVNMSIRRITIFAPLAAVFLLFSGIHAHAQTVDTWDSRAALTAATDARGSRLAYPGSGDFIYETRGDTDTSLNRYSISGNSWTALTSSNCGAAIGDDSLLIAGDSGFLYASCPGGNGTTDFVRYNISGDSWANRTTSPFGLLGSAGGAVWDGGNLIYALGGTTFASYSISGNSWTSLTGPVAGSLAGGSLAYPGSGDFIYSFRGGDTNTFRRYSISGDSWSNLTSPPNTVGGGGALVAPNTSTLYALSGISDSGAGPSTNFWSYSISGDSWTTLAVAPAAVGEGGSLAYVSNSSGTFLFQTRGNSTTDFNRYTISLAASTGGSAGSAYLLARQDAGLSLARGTPPASPTNVVVTPTACNGACGANIAFSYTTLAVHQGRPLTFAFIDESGQTLGSIYEPFAGIKSYTLALNNIAPNSPLSGRLCAQFGPGSGCVNAQSWMLFGLDPAKITLKSEIDGARYRVRVSIPAYPNEGVEQSNVRLEVTENVGKVFGTTLKRSGESFVSLPPGNYTFTLTPVNARGVVGAPVKLPLMLKSFGEALTLDVGARVAERQFSSGFIAASNRLGNNGFELLMERRGEALQFTADNGASVEVRLSITATLVPPHTTKVNGAVASEKEQFTFVFLCVPGGTCKPVSSLAEKGNVVTRAADIREGLVTAKTSDAIVTANMNGALAHATVNVIGKELSGLEGTLEFSAGRLRGGKGEVVVTVGDALGNKIAKSAPVSIVGAPARITLFDIAALAEPEEEGDVVARAIVDYRDFAERALLLNLSFTEETLTVLSEPLPTAPRLVQVLVTRDDGTGVQFALPCEENCGIGAVAAPTGTPLEVAVEENPDGTVRASAGGVTLTYDAANALPLLVSADEAGLRLAEAGAVHAEAGFARAELRARYASFGFGNMVGELRANEALARAAFAGTGGFLNLFPEVIERVIFDLAPLIINYIAPQNLAPVIESVLGARVEALSRPVRIIREASEVGAPVSPLLNTLRNLLAP